MRLAIYVPQARALAWDPHPETLTWDRFQHELVELAGGITVTSATGRWKGRMGMVQEPVFVAEVFVQRDPNRPGSPTTGRIGELWSLIYRYARQLLAEGEESVLILQDNEPTLIR
jgi:hypothetical protein